MHTRCITALPKKQRGFSVLDLIITATVSSILMAVAIPAIASLNAQFKYQASKQVLLNLIKTARSHSINDNSYTNVCHLINNTCAGLQSPLSLYTDNNNNGKLDLDDALITLRTIDNVSLSWNKHKRIRFNPRGQASGYNGTLSYCNNDSGFKIIIARTGRIRTENTAKHCKNN